MHHDLLGPAIRQGIEKGREQGLPLGRLDVLKDQIQHRFGTGPSRAEQKLLDLSAPKLRRISVQILHAATLEKLFKEDLFNITAR